MVTEMQRWTSGSALIRTYTLNPMMELRIITDSHSNQSAAIRLLPTIGADQGSHEGTAEIFGVEMVAGKDYEVPPGSRTAIYSWGGCRLEVRGHVTQEYEALNSSMRDYLQLSAALNARRQLAAIKHTLGPKVLVTGSASCGKSSVCTALCNYAVRCNWSPVFVELDTRGSSDRSGYRFLPGTIGCSIVTAVLTKEPKDVLCYFYGHTEAESDKERYLEVCRYLSVALHRRLAHNLERTKWMTHRDELSEAPFPAASGIIVNSPCEASSDLLFELTGIFGIDIVVVLDNPSLKHHLAQRVRTSSESVTVLGMFKQEGVVAVDKERLRELRFQGYEEYFKNSFAVRVKLSELRLICFASSLALSALPNTDASEAADSAKQVVYWNGPAMSLLNAVLAVSTATDRESAHEASIKGVVYVRNIEERESEDSEEKRDFALDFLCHNVSCVTSSLLIVPADRQLKWWQHRHG